MTKADQIKRVRLVLVIFLVILVILTLYLASGYFGLNLQAKNTPVLSPLSGDISGSVTRSSPAEESTVRQLPSSEPLPTEIKENYSITLMEISTGIREGDLLTFTWNVNGLVSVIHKTTVYFGENSTPGELLTDYPPERTGYKNYIPDFMDGDYSIPLRFVASTGIGNPGEYFARAYALINGKHYWSDEKAFAVSGIPKHEIKVIQFPDEVYKGANAAFTWEIIGPQARTGFTAIVGGRQSLPGKLETSVILQDTPYSVLTADFTSGSYDVPLRFIGNKVFQDTGIYYFRALSFINNKNIWSEEYNILVK